MVVKERSIVAGYDCYAKNMADSVIVFPSVDESAE